MKAFVAKWRRMVELRRARVAVTNAIPCPVCLLDVSQKTMFTTPCQHAFCTPCMEALVAVHETPFGLPCPLCRAPFHYVKSRPPFDPTLYPSKADFAFVPEQHERGLLHSAYKTITREKAWAYLYQYCDVAGYGFIYTDDKEIQRIIMRIEDDYCGHSGGSMGFTMRRMHRVAQIGYAAYAEEFKKTQIEQHDMNGVLAYRVSLQSEE